MIFEGVSVSANSDYFKKIISGFNLMFFRPVGWSNPETN
jgi:hypothetical protein